MKGKGIISCSKKIGLEKYSEIPAHKREIIALEIQMKNPSWKRTTKKFKKGVKKYYQINKSKQ